AYSGFIAPISAFTPYWSFTAMTSTIIGGIRTLLGPIIGAFIIVFLRQQFLVIFPGLSPLVFGIIMATTVLLAPQGILGIAPKIYRSLKIRLKSIKKIKILS
ncbi:MAG: hypothetical protein QXL74_08105, partial [Candidatus Bathyarchaeia archaeon]